MSIRAHRFSYQLHNGKIRNHDCVCHSCDNPKCVNPAHLWIGTRAENNADKEAKKRGVYPVQSNGEANTNSILTTPEVIAARVMARKGLPQARIAKLLGVSTATVCMIVNGERRSEETEQRVSACVNACAGAKTEDLEALGSDYIKVYAQTIKQRDELLEVLLTAAETFASYAEIHAAKTPPDIVKAEFNRDRAQMCFAAIASVKGEQ
jgi:predicted transcriptional regulator